MYVLIATSIAVLYFLHVIGKRIPRFCTSKKRLDGKTVLVTGGTMGLGLQAAIDFANRGARLIIACPFKNEGMNAKQEIEARTSNKNVIFKLLDLSSLQSVRGFAADILRSEDRLDILVNNAGVGTVGDFATADGMNFIMQVNYYGHFLLTLLLLPLLKKTGTQSERSRIVNMSSIMHRLALSDVTNYNKIGYYWFNFFIYSNSKFCFVLFARELSKRLNDSNVVVNCVDPGFVATNIYHSVNVVFGIVVNILINLFFNNPWEGVQTTLSVSLDEEAGRVSGKYFRNCKITRPRKMAYDDAKAELLWKDSVKLVKLSDEEVEQCFK
ncbi:retinol dehydrogenase 12-like [Epargyreus clarus]|uniref:retinol dehydrogenase 12-like n=1 Tax=Epargyreus clarus TaxID=520877 RepID=UPI003C2ACB0A